MPAPACIRGSAEQRERDGMTGRTTKALLALVIFMGVLIVVGTTALVAVIAHRLTHRPAAVATRTVPLQPAASDTAASVLADEPAGTRIVAVTRVSDGLLAVALSGGGQADRVLLWDLAAGRIGGRLALAAP
jgi:hypothetical protein